MSLKFVKSRVEEFLHSEVPEVMAIKGDWGVGKTFTWDQFLKELKAKEKVTLNQYSYVSLFGINSLEALKLEVFHNTINKELISDRTVWQTINENPFEALLTHWKKLKAPFVSLLASQGVSISIDAIAFWSVRKQIICIDDLERCGEGLDVKDVLGLVTQLKEQKECKVVLLLNDNEVSTTQYDKYKEKVIDYELEFSPTTEECADVAFSDTDVSDLGLREYALRLGIRNIRVMVKISRLAKFMIPLMGDWHESTRSQFAHSLVLFCWAYYCSKTNPEVPPLEYIENIDRARYLGMSDEEFVSEETKEQREQEERWNNKLHAYEFLTLDDIDSCIAQAVRSGFFNEQSILEAVEKKHQEILVGEKYSEFSAAWELYHQSFDDNAKEVADAIFQSVVNFPPAVNLVQLDVSVALLKELGFESQAIEMLEKYISARSKETDLFDLSRTGSLSEPKDPDVIAACDKIHLASMIRETPEEVLRSMRKKNGWSPEQEKVLADTSVDDYYKIFKAAGKERNGFITTSLQFGTFSSSTGQQQEIARKATEALTRIAGESKINEMRAKQYGIRAQEDKTESKDSDSASGK